MIAPKIWKLVMWSLNARCTLRMLLHLLSEQTEWNMTTETTGEAVVVAVHSNKELHTGSSSYQWDLSVFQYNWGYRLGVIIEREREGVYVCLSIFIKKKKQLKKKGVVGQEQLLPFAFILQNEGVEWKELLAAGSPYFVFLKISSFPSSISQILERYFNIYWLLRNNTRPRNLWGLHFTWAVFFYSVFLCSFLCRSLVWKLPKLLLAATL